VRHRLHVQAPPDRSFLPRPTLRRATGQSTLAAASSSRGSLVSAELLKAWRTASSPIAGVDLVAGHARPTQVAAAIGSTTTSGPVASRVAAAIGCSNLTAIALTGHAGDAPAKRPEPVPVNWSSPDTWVSRVHLSLSCDETPLRELHRHHLASASRIAACAPHARHSLMRRSRGQRWLSMRVWDLPLDLGLLNSPCP
jgi:hypothetical protein